MFSVTKIGTWRRPSCTPRVSPIISGTTVDQRAHVLITVFWPERLTASTFFISFWSIAGPFFADLDIMLPQSRLSSPPLDNHPVGRFGLAGLVSQRRLAPGRLRPGQTDGASTLTTAMRMVARGHCRATHRRPLAL